MADTPNHRDRRLPNDGGGPGPWQQVAGSLSLREGTSPTARGGGREKRSSRSPSPVGASSPPPHPPSQEPPLPGDGHTLPVDRSLHAPSAPLGCSPAPEVQVAAAAAAPSGLALTTSTAFNGSSTTSRAAKPERLPSASAAPRPGPAHCPRLSEGPPLPNPAPKAFSASVTHPGRSGQAPAPSAVLSRARALSAPGSAPQDRVGRCRCRDPTG